MVKEIAQLSMHITTEPSLALQDSVPWGSEFMGLEKTMMRNSDVHIEVKLGEMPNIEFSQEVFDTTSWTMFRDNKGYALVMRSTFIGQPLWIARICQDFSHVTLFCGDRLVRSRSGVIVLSNPVTYPFDQILLMYVLGQRQGAIIHAAGMIYQGNGYLFPGKSGAGKSTISRLFATNDRFQLLSDDRIIVRNIDGAYRMYGTPWPGEAQIAVNAYAPLTKLFFITHSHTTQISEISAQEALNRFLPVISIPWHDRAIVDAMLAWCGDLLSAIPAYELSFTPDAEVVEVVEQFLSS